MKNWHSTKVVYYTKNSQGYVATLDTGTRILVNKIDEKSCLMSIKRDVWVPHPQLLTPINIVNNVVTFLECPSNTSFLLDYDFNGS